MSYNLNGHFQSLDYEIRGSKLYEFLFEQPKVHVRNANKTFFLRTDSIGVITYYIDITIVKQNF